MLIGCIADDLTGATDLAVTLAREGLSVARRARLASLAGRRDRATRRPGVSVIAP